MKNAPGYSLIEIIIVVAIMLTTIGGGIAAYLNFQQNQAITGAVNELKVYLRSAQTRARSGDRPELCDRLVSYAIRTVSGTKQYQMVAVCENGEYVRRDGELQGDGITVEGTYDIEFLTLQGGVSGATIIEVRSETGRGYEFEVTQGGEITEGDFIEE